MPRIKEAMDYCEKNHFDAFVANQMRWRLAVPNRHEEDDPMFDGWHRDNRWWPIFVKLRYRLSCFRRIRGLGFFMNDCSAQVISAAYSNIESTPTPRNPLHR